MFSQDLKIWIKFLIFFGFGFLIAHGHYMGVQDEKNKDLKIEYHMGADTWGAEDERSF